MTGAALTKIREALEPCTVADAVILEAVVTLAVAGLADRVIEITQLLSSCDPSHFSVIILTVYALTNVWVTSYSTLKADTVKLATLASFTVASSTGCCLTLQI